MIETIKSLQLDLWGRVIYDPKDERAKELVERYWNARGKIGSIFDMMDDKVLPKEAGHVGVVSRRPNEIHQYQVIPPKGVHTSRNGLPRQIFYSIGPEESTLAFSSIILDDSIAGNEIAHLLFVHCATSMHGGVNSLRLGEYQKPVKGGRIECIKKSAIEGILPLPNSLCSGGFTIYSDRNMFPSPAESADYFLGILETISASRNLFESVSLLRIEL